MGREDQQGLPLPSPPTWCEFSCRLCQWGYVSKYICYRHMHLGTEVEGDRGRQYEDSMKCKRNQDKHTFWVANQFFVIKNALKRQFLWVQTERRVPFFWENFTCNLRCGTVDTKVGFIFHFIPQLCLSPQSLCEPVLCVSLAPGRAMEYDSGSGPILNGWNLRCRRFKAKKLRWTSYSVDGSQQPVSSTTVDIKLLVARFHTWYIVSVCTAPLALEKIFSCVNTFNLQMWFITSLLYIVCV